MRYMYISTIYIISVLRANEWLIVFVNHLYTNSSHNFTECISKRRRETKTWLWYLSNAHVLQQVGDVERRQARNKMKFKGETLVRGSSLPWTLKRRHCKKLLKHCRTTLPCIVVKWWLRLSFCVYKRLKIFPKNNTCLWRAGLPNTNDFRQSEWRFEAGDAASTRSSRTDVWLPRTTGHLSLTNGLLMELSSRAR